MPPGHQPIKTSQVPEVLEEHREYARLQMFSVCLQSEDTINLQKECPLRMVQL